jgi:hypothetical protein
MTFGSGQSMVRADHSTSAGRFACSSVMAAILAWAAATHRLPLSHIDRVELTCRSFRATTHNQGRMAVTTHTAPRSRTPTGVS